MKNKNTLLIIAGICLLVLALLCTTIAVINRLGLLRMGFPDGSNRLTPLGQGFINQDGSEPGFEVPEDFQPGEGFDPQGGMTIPEGGEMPEGGFTMPEGGFPGGGRFQGGTITGNLGRSGSVLGWIGVALYGVALILAGVAAIGIFKCKKWGAILGIIVATGLGIASAFGLIRFMGWSTLAIAIVKVLLAVAVITLLLLKPSRALWNVKKDDLGDLDDGDLDYDEEEGADLVTNRIEATKPGEGMTASQPVTRIVDDDVYDEDAEEKDL
jgi:hypothetical protein